MFNVMRNFRVVILYGFDLVKPNTIRTKRQAIQCYNLS